MYYQGTHKISLNHSLSRLTHVRALYTYSKSIVKMYKVFLFIHTH